MLETASLTCFLLPLLLQSYIIAWLRGPCPSAWLLNSLCLSLREIILPRWHINSYNKIKRLTHPSECWPLRGDVLQDWRAFLLDLSCLFLSILPFDFNSSLLLSESIKEPGIQTPRWLLWDMSLSSSQFACFLKKVIFLALILHLLDSFGMLRGEQSKLRLGIIIIKHNNRDMRSRSCRLYCSFHITDSAIPLLLMPDNCLLLFPWWLRW